MKLSRILQPCHPMFWMCVALNAWSSAISFILRTQELPALVTLLLAGFVITNVVLGLPIALRLMPDPESIQAGLPASRTRGKEVPTPSHAPGADLLGWDKPVPSCLPTTILPTPRQPCVVSRICEDSKRKDFIGGPFALREIAPQAFQTGVGCFGARVVDANIASEMGRVVRS